jgi:hypothetical protein
LAELPYHLAHAQAWSGLRDTLTSFAFLEAKLAALGVYALIEDYDLAYLSQWQAAKISNAEEIEHLRLIQEAIRLSVPVINHDPFQLASQLTGRLLPFKNMLTHDFIKSICEYKKSPWLRPQVPCLVSPGGPLIFTLAGHKKAIRAIAMSPNGRLAASSCDGGVLKLWDLLMGRELWSKHLKNTNIREIVITPDERLVVSLSVANAACKDKWIVIVWDLKTYRLIRTKTFTNKKAVALSLDGRRIVSASIDRVVQIWDIETARLLLTIEIDRDASVIALSPNGLRVIAKEGYSSLRVWDTKTGQPIYFLAEEAGLWKKKCFK